MDQALVDVFEQARKVVADADRTIAEEEARRRQSERESLLQLLGARIEDAFDFTSKEKLELQPRLDVQEGVGVVEFVVRSQRAIFLLLPGEGNTWTLQVVEDSHKPQVLIPPAGSGTHRDCGRQLGSKRQGTSGCFEHETIIELARPRRAEARAHLRNHGQIPRLLEVDFYDATSDFSVS